jgi:hypothetical protein
MGAAAKTRRKKVFAAWIGRPRRFSALAPRLDSAPARRQ